MSYYSRKQLRLNNYDYSSAGAYFITICTKDNKQILAKIVVGDGVLTVPDYTLTPYGIICEKHIQSLNNFYENVNIDKYVIMPNHIHMLISVSVVPQTVSRTNSIPDVIRSFKSLVTRDIGVSIWQRSYNDHIIRNQEDYNMKWKYIDANIIRWKNDDLYS